MGKSQRRKGHDFERRIVRWLKAMGMEDAKRNLGETGSQDLGVDVSGTFRLTGRWAVRGTLMRLLVQAKHKKAPSVWRAMEEARTAKRSPFELPVAIVKRTHDQTLVCMDPEAFALLVCGREESL